MVIQSVEPMQPGFEWPFRQAQGYDDLLASEAEFAVPADHGQNLATHTPTGLAFGLVLAARRIFALETSQHKRSMAFTVAGSQLRTPRHSGGCTHR
jgi:hypothetical protein